MLKIHCASLADQRNAGVAAADPDALTRRHGLVVGEVVLGAPLGQSCLEGGIGRMNGCQPGEIALRVGRGREIAALWRTIAGQYRFLEEVERRPPEPRYPAAGRPTATE